MKHNGNIPTLKDVVERMKTHKDHSLYTERFFKLAYKENGDLNCEHDPLKEAKEFMKLMSND